ncbi:hypothetical protein [Timonella sp. A28]|uniref:hypothetical protein n=1 Tax=Timonella sp. A28 TaxID=3442640 RepID=UPI003EB7D921
MNKARIRKICDEITELGHPLTDLSELKTWKTVPREVQDVLFATIENKKLDGDVRAFVASHFPTKGTKRYWPRLKKVWLASADNTPALSAALANYFADSSAPSDFEALAEILADSHYGFERHLLFKRFSRARDAQAMDYVRRFIDDSEIGEQAQTVINEKEKAQQRTQARKAKQEPVTPAVVEDAAEAPEATATPEISETLEPVVEEASAVADTEKPADEPVVSETPVVETDIVETIEPVEPVAEEVPTAPDVAPEPVKESAVTAEQPVVLEDSPTVETVPPAPEHTEEPSHDAVTAPPAPPADEQHVDVVPQAKRQSWLARLSKFIKRSPEKSSTE